MIRVRWELEEAVALMDLYFRYGATLSVPNDELLKLSQIYRNRANILGLNVDDKFRNLSGMKMQLGCIFFGFVWHSVPPSSFRVKKKRATRRLLAMYAM